MLRQSPGIELLKRESQKYPYVLSQPQHASTITFCSGLTVLFLTRAKEAERHGEGTAGESFAVPTAWRNV